MWTRLSILFIALLGATAGTLIGGVIGGALAASRRNDDLAVLVLGITVPIGAGIGTLVSVIWARRYLHD